MKHEVIKADMTFKKVGFIFECKYFDSKGDINKIEKVTHILFYKKNFLLISLSQF